MDHNKQWEKPEILDLGDAMDIIQGFNGKEPGPSDGIIDANRFSS